MVLFQFSLLPFACLLHLYVLICHPSFGASVSQSSSSSSLTFCRCLCHHTTDVQSQHFLFFLFFSPLCLCIWVECCCHLESSSACCLGNYDAKPMFDWIVTKVSFVRCFFFFLSFVHTRESKLRSTLSLLSLFTIHFLHVHELFEC